MEFTKVLWLICLLFFASCENEKSIYIHEDDYLKIKKLSETVFQHISFLETEKYGKVPCNGMVVIDKGEAIVVDTPADLLSSEKLIQWITETKKSKIKAVVPTHFHVDCLGGLASFHRYDIPSYAYEETITLVDEDKFETPSNSFHKDFELQAGNTKLNFHFPGEGHTKDNIVAYVPDEGILFGGCLVKSLKSGKGNLDDANVNEWSNSVSAVKNKFQDVQLVIPGHGSHGDIELLDYTIKKFELN